MEKPEADDTIFELTESEHILNLDFYLHRAILKWQDALDSALRHEKDIDTGLVNRGLAGDMVEGIAKAKGLVHWEKEPIPEKEGKKRDAAIKNNKESEEFKEKYKEFKDEIEKTDTPKNIKNAKISDYKVFEILKTISKSSTKKGTVII